jgi:hypothetical protein
MVDCFEVREKRRLGVEAGSAPPPGGVTLGAGTAICQPRLLILIPEFSGGLSYYKNPTNPTNGTQAIDC